MQWVWIILKPSPYCPFPGHWKANWFLVPERLGTFTLGSCPYCFFIFPLHVFLEAACSATNSLTTVIFSTTYLLDLRHIFSVYIVYLYLNILLVPQTQDMQIQFNDISWYSRNLCFPWCSELSAATTCPARCQSWIQILDSSLSST